MKRIMTQALVLILPLAACAAVSPFASGTNVFNGLALRVCAEKMVYSQNEKPVITVVFSNQSDKSIALLNHFAYCAEGPVLIASQFEPDGTCQTVEFEKQICMPQHTNHWITIEPHATFQFQSSIYKPLTTSGAHRLQVSYRVEGPAFMAIKQCQEKEGAPKDFWQGILVSKEIRIEVSRNAFQQNLEKIEVLVREKAKEFNINLQNTKFELYQDNAVRVAGFTRELPVGTLGDNLVLGINYDRFTKDGEVVFVSPR